MTGGYWHREYEPAQHESDAAARRSRELAHIEQQRAEAVETASAELRRACTPREVACLIRAAETKSTADRPLLGLFDEKSCASAWLILMTSGEFPATHDVIEWKARFREWGFYFRWLPDHVVRETRHARASVWEIPGEWAWVDMGGHLYRLAGTSPVAKVPARAEMHSGLLDLAVAGYGRAVVPCGERFKTDHRRSSPYSRLDHYVVDGFHVEFADLPRCMAFVNGWHLARFLSHLE
jgi:hypothetical protein